jgi:glycosyltransferase involved in cell wall biosynthesis
MRIDTHHPILKLVIPFFVEEESVQQVCEGLRQVFSIEGDLTWELIMVDDSSKDSTPQLIDELANRYDNFRALHPRPNSRQPAALEAGFEVALGEFIATLDGDCVRSFYAQS